MRSPPSAAAEHAARAEHLLQRRFVDLAVADIGTGPGLGTTSHTVGALKELRRARVSSARLSTSAVSRYKRHHSFNDQPILRKLS